ncbi:MAG: tRNA preQ1(34) S-adenosylmethionine ribosyltransferase-isomerase QueA [Candidatus Falkowbacteria bacterium]|nr:tRNA preQ1(34) S-adenosylmethionine ribosyltransferase-isomerase QueA [Candidatus Falkowbacteria bacterium]
MQLKDFDYNLPKELIAQEPKKPRDQSRLLVLAKDSGKIEHKHFFNLIEFLQSGDVLVLNNSKVFPARLIGKKQPYGGKIEIFLLRHLTPACAGRPALSLLRRGRKGEVWECLLGGRGGRVGLCLEFGHKLSGEIIANHGDGTWEIKFNKPSAATMKIIQRIGKVPLPPYIKRKKYFYKSDIANYQTVYAEKIGSVAAPTAGFHFTPQLLKKIKAKGVQVEYVTLHVGLGTFAPVKVNDITKHKMHSEWAEIDKKTMKHIVQAKSEGRRIIAMGTTSARTLESFSNVILSACLPCLRRQGRQAAKNLVAMNQNRQDSQRDPHALATPELRMTAMSGWTDIFIYPGYKFKVVDALITNFHLPKSTLLMLVSALTGKKNIDKAYQEAIKKKYRFYSYGDAMFIY